MSDAHDNYIEGGNDDRDVNSPAVIRLGILLAILILVSMGAMWVLTARLIAHEAKGHAPRSPAAPSGMVVPDRPLLQPVPPQTFQAFRAKESARLSSYGWADQASGKVHIPISAAKKLALKQGFSARDGHPTFSEATVPTDGSLSGVRP